MKIKFNINHLLSSLVLNYILRICPMWQINNIITSTYFIIRTLYRIPKFLSIWNLLNAVILVIPNYLAQKTPTHYHLSVTIILTCILIWIFSLRSKIYSLTPHPIWCIVYVKWNMLIISYLVKCVIISCSMKQILLVQRRVLRKQFRIL